MAEISLHEEIFQDEEDEESGQEKSESEEETGLDEAEKYPCSICGKVVHSLATLIAHMQEHQELRKTSKDKGSTKFNCADCGQRFALSRDMRKHVCDVSLSEVCISTLAGNFQCAECEFVFKQSEELEEHVNKKHGRNAKTSNQTIVEKSVSRKRVPDVSSSKFSKSMKAKSCRNISIVDESFLCECGF